MERNVKWQDVLLVALRAALLAVLTLLGDQLAGGRPSDLIGAVLLPDAARPALLGSSWKSSSLELFVPASLSLSGKRWLPRHA